MFVEEIRNDYLFIPFFFQSPGICDQPKKATFTSRKQTLETINHKEMTFNFTPTRLLLLDLLLLNLLSKEFVSYLQAPRLAPILVPVKMN